MSLPWILRAETPSTELVAWAAPQRDGLETALATHGGVLFRGFAPHGPEGLQRFVNLFCGEALPYKERSSPRQAVSGNVYTSTEYPANEIIPQHNENSYAHTWPLKLFFQCEIAATEGGATPICDSRRVLARLSAATRARFEKAGVLYTRAFASHLGLSWQNVFQTTDRALVEGMLRDGGYEFEWDDDVLRTRRVGQAIARHPRTGEATWFNHAAFFHVTSMPELARDLVMESFEPRDYPNHAYYGDGTPIEDETLAEIRAAFAAETVRFDWQPGDVLLLDNMLAAHGRDAFVGPRRILVAMGSPQLSACGASRPEFMMSSRSAAEKY